MRRRGGGGISRVLNEETLRRRIETCYNHRNSNLVTTDDVVEYLHSNYPDYKRIKQQPFSRFVSQYLHRMPINNSKKPKQNDDEEGGVGSSRKKLKRTAENENEERLTRIEQMHVDKRRRSESSSESESESESGEEEEEEDSWGVSTSEDAIYEEKVEPAFDVLKDMLRSSYSGSKNAGKPKGKETTGEKLVELEVNCGKEKKTQVLGESTKRDNAKVADSGAVSESGAGAEVKGKQGGPRFKDLGGMEGVLEEIKREVIVPLLNPQVPLRLGIKPTVGILLHGPPGCGKTNLAHAIANETGVPFYKISATEVVSGVSGASEENIRELFSKAYRTAPSVVFIDEIDAIASKRDNLQRAMEQRIVTQLMTCMGESDHLVQPNELNSGSEVSDHIPGYVLVIGATNRPDALDPAIRRPGRFDREIVLGVPDENARLQILSVVTRNLRLEGSFDLMKIARSTPGFVGADLSALANQAGILAMKRIIDERKSSRESMDEATSEEWWRQLWSPEEIDKVSITMADFEEAAKMVQPSSRREGFSAIPNVKWEDVGGLDHLRQEFDRYIVRRIKYPEDYKEFGVDLETGFLLYGPPGCGKTLIAKAVANEAGANFIHIKGPELLNKYVGESELAVRMLFSRARTCAPCVLFFDEVDALTTKRGKEGGWVVERLLNQLLIELDGSEQRKGVFVIGATNRPEVMDRAVLRPGRFGKLLYVPLPTPEERGLILKALARKKPIDANVDLCAIGCMKACENLSGADLSALINEAAMIALEEKLTSIGSSSGAIDRTINTAHIERALSKISPSVSDKQKQYYHRLSESFKAA